MRISASATTCTDFGWFQTRNEKQEVTNSHRGPAYEVLPQNDAWHLKLRKYLAQAIEQLAEIC